MVADGDNKVYHYIEKNPQDVPYKIEKFECANHLQKRAHKALLNFGINYAGEGNVPSGKARKKPLDPNTPSVADFFSRLPIRR